MKADTEVEEAEFVFRFSATRRRARLARQVAVEVLEHLGFPGDGHVTSAVAAITAELAANAVTHGRLPGREFELRLLLRADAVRVEVSDARPEKPLPARVVADAPSAESDGGRGLLLVEALADQWGWRVRDAFVKTVWAEVAK